MRLVLLLVVIVVVGVCLGWLHFSSGNDAGTPHVTVSVDKDKIEADKNTVVEKVQNLGHRPADKTAVTTQKAPE